MFSLYFLSCNRFMKVLLTWLRLAPFWAVQRSHCLPKSTEWKDFSWDVDSCVLVFFTIRSHLSSVSDVFLFFQGSVSEREHGQQPFEKWCLVCFYVFNSNIISCCIVVASGSQLMNKSCSIFLLHSVTVLGILVFATTKKIGRKTKILAKKQNTFLFPLPFTIAYTLWSVVLSNEKQDSSSLRLQKFIA